MAGEQHRQSRPSAGATAKTLMQAVSLRELLARSRQECRGLLRLQLSGSGLSAFQERAAALNRLTVKLSMVLPRCVEQAGVWAAFRALHLLLPWAVETLKVQLEARPQR